jgi:stage V sporulation protein S
MENELSATTIKVSGKTSPKAAAGSLATVLSEFGYAEIIAIGAAAVNQSVKAVAICSGYVAPTGVDLIMKPAFETTEIDGNERTRMKLYVGPR